MKKAILILTISLFGAASAVAQLIPRNGLVAYYMMDSNGFDSSGNNNHATGISVTSTTNRFGQAGKAMRFNGWSSYMTAPATASLSPDSFLSYAVWIAPESKATGWNPVFCRRYAVASAPYDSYGLTTNNTSPFSNRWMFTLSNGAASSSLTEAWARYAFVDAAWMFVAATYDGSAMRLYINGNLDTTVAFSGQIGYSSMPLYIGYNSAGPNEYYKGNIDELAIYNRVLTPAEITMMYNGTTGLEDAAASSSRTLRVYPNPATDVLHVEGVFADTDRLRILNTMGQEMYAGTAGGNIDISALRAGMYIVEVTAEDGTHTSRFIRN